MTHPVRDIFEEQENVFKFLNKYKSTQREVFPALAKRFELKNSKNATESLDINSKQLMEEKLLIKTLEDKVSHLISELDKVKVERENLESVKNDIFNGVKNRDSLLAEKEKYSNEYKMLVDTKEYYETRLEQLNTIIETIDAELHYLLDRGGDSDSIRQLQDKKTIFDYERTSIEKNLKNISLISRQTSDSINIINKEIERIEKYDENDVKDLINKIEEMAQKQDYKYKELVESESKLKGLKVKNNNKQLQFEQSHTYIDSSIQNIESGSIINYLTSNTQPAAISAVMRYIRDYFCYYTTLVSGNIMKALPNQNIYITQAIATRLVLMDYFGINFNNLFSVFDFDHASLKNLILITKD